MLSRLFYTWHSLFTAILLVLTLVMQAGAQDVSRNYLCTAVKTDLQRHLLSKQGEVAFAVVDGMSFVERGSHKIDANRFDFEGFRSAMASARKQSGPGTLHLCVDWGLVEIHTDQPTYFFVRNALTEMARQAGFDDIHATASHPTECRQVVPNSPRVSPRSAERLIASKCRQNNSLRNKNRASLSVR